MKRNVLMVLLGTSLFIPIDADAQRPRSRVAPPARQSVAQNSGRLAECRSPGNGRAFVCADDRRPGVVYRYSDRTARGTWISPRWAWIDISFPRHSARRGAVDGRRLRRLIGPQMVHRVRDHGRRAGLRGQLRGRWLPNRRLGTVLALTMEGQEVARLVDYDRDGFVDDVRIRSFRGPRRVAARTW